MKRIIYFVLFLSSLVARVQDFAITKVELTGENVNIYFDLLDSTAKRTYT